MTQKERLTKVNQPGAYFSRIGVMSLGSELAMDALGFMALISVLVPLIVPYSPEEIFTKWIAPSGEYLFSTDHVGRDTLSRVPYGGHLSLMIDLSSALTALFFGAIIGSVAAVARKSASEVIMQILDIVMAAPGIAMTAVSVPIFGCALQKAGNVSALVLVIAYSMAFVYIPQLSRIVRTNAMVAYGEDCVRAVIVADTRAPWVLVKHVMHSTAIPILVFATVLVADAIILEVSLTFIGSGLQATTAPTWGNILSEASSNLSVMLGYWWTAFFPGVFIMATIPCLNILPEGITDAMAAAPKGPAVVQVSSGVQREADRLLFDPRRAYAEQVESLQARLDALEKVESACDDRFESTSTEVPLLEVKGLCIKSDNHEDVSVVDHVSFSVRPGETMGLVGESGCGRSVISLSIMGLISPKLALSGKILHQGRSLLDISPDECQKFLGHEMAMTYQDALSSLNPAMLIKTQMKQLTSRDGIRSAEELLELVGSNPKYTLESYPHELPGGQCQCVLIVMVLTRDPKLAIADEPITVLDVIVQKQVTKLLNELREKPGFVMIFVSHDITLVVEVAHSTTVMYAGQVVEQGPTSEPLEHPTHEYTRDLLGTVSPIETGSGRLHQVPGIMPLPRDFPKGDRFVPRSSYPDYGLDIRPVLTEVSPSHAYAALPPHPEGNEASCGAGEEN